MAFFSIKHVPANEKNILIIIIYILFINKRVQSHKNKNDNIIALSIDLQVIT